MCCRHTSYLADVFVVVVVLFGGCFATDVYFELGGCFAAIPLLWRMLYRCGCAIWWMLRHRFVVLALPWHLSRQYILFVQVQLFGWPLGGWQDWSVLPLRASVVRLLCLWLWSLVCFPVLFFSVFVSSVLCALVLVNLCLAISSFVSVTA